MRMRGLSLNILQAVNDSNIRDLIIHAAKNV